MGRWLGQGCRIDVLLGENGEEVAGVDKALRFVDMESSITVRDARRKERTAECEEQSEGVRAGGGGG